MVQVIGQARKMRAAVSSVAYTRDSEDFKLVEEMVDRLMNLEAERRPDTAAVD